MKLNIDDYNIDDLLQITKLDTELPLTVEKITTKIKELVKTGKNENIKQFYKEAGAYLIYHYDDEKRNKEKLNKLDDLDGDGEDDYKTFFTEIQHTIIDNKKTTIQKQFSDHVVQGNKNPNYINHVHENIFISSVMRKKKHATVMCNVDIQQKDLYTSTDYILDLETVKKDVLSIYITDVTIPKTWYTFDDEYNTSSFMLDDTIYKINNGNYTAEELVHELNLLNDSEYVEDTYINVNPTELNFSYNKNTRKISIRNLSNKKRTIKWFFNTYTCGTNKITPRINYNLGVLLGFKELSYVIDSSGSGFTAVIDTITGQQTKKHLNVIHGEQVVNVEGCTHFFISIDEFNNNKPNQTVTSCKIQSDNYKLPKYYNPQTMDISLGILDVNEMESAKNTNRIFDASNTCQPIPNNKDNPKHLTKNQKFTILRIQEEMNRYKIDNIDNKMIQSIHIPDVIATVPVTKDVGNNINWTFNEENNQKRIYFGPVRLNKLRIRLYNDKGFLVNLNGGDWAFKMIAKCLYQL